MTIVISGVNNNDKITASDGKIDILSGVDYNSEVTAPSFKVGSDIQLGNAGVATATTFVGNLTGNVNNTGNLLLQIGGSEKFRVGGSGQLGIGGANYGTSGQVLTSGGSGSAATWSTVSGTTINNNADNRVITGSGSANTLEGEATLTFTNSGSAAQLNLKRSTSSNQEAIFYYGSSNLEIETREATGIKLKTNTSDRLTITSAGSVNIGGSSTQTTHLLHLQSTGDAGIHIRADSDNSGENDNPYLSMSQDGSSAQELKIGQNGDAGQNFPESLANSPFIHANHSTAYPLQLAHMDTMVVNIANRKNELALEDYGGNTIAGMEIHHRGNDTGVALKFTGHNNSGGTPGNETFTQFTHLGANAKFMVHHVGGTAIQIGSTRRIDLPAVYGTAISSPMRDLHIESTGQLGYNPSVRASKINIADNNDVSWLYNLTPKTYNKRKRVSQDTNEWSNEAESDLQYGLIAEEVEPVNSNICFYDVDDSNTKKLAGVTYSQLITPLLKAIQEQKAEIDALKTRVATLEGS
tara:strand:- start:694 stop:2265 length:1572 start_codon:yes stop_codon:yes gene_type:complete